MLNFIFAIVMVVFIFFTTFLVASLILCLANAILERLTGIGFYDILRYAFDSISSGIKSFFSYI